MDDNEELNHILEKERKVKPAKMTLDDTKCEAVEPPSAGEELKAEKPIFVQWTTPNHRTYYPSTHSANTLKPGLYEINMCNHQIYFDRVSLGTEGLIRFPDSNSLMVVQEIEKFWGKEEKFKKYNLTFKRGILLWGPPGSGKTATVKLIIDDIIKRKGVVFKFCRPGIFMDGLRIFRDIQPDTPCIVLMEDLDSIVESFHESDVINILDGVDMIDKVAFIATTNYPERLGSRIVNRPSRFDKRVKIGHPSKVSRKMYFEHLFSCNGDSKGFDLDTWVEDTEGLSIAHLKELFVSVVIIGDEYQRVIAVLKSMKDHLDPIHGDRPMGISN
jgi:hypothetical protein